MASTITVRRGNASKVQLGFSSMGIMSMLDEHLTFEVEGARFTPKFKSGQWDGKIRLFDKRNMTMPTGLVDNMKQFANRYNVDVVEEWLPPKEVAPSMDVVADFVKSLNLPFVPYPHQIKALLRIIKKRRTVILSPTSSGKSLIIYMACEWFKRINPDENILVIVPSVGLVSQMADDFVGYGGEAPFGIKAGVNKEDSIGHRVIVSTWQSIYKEPRSFFEARNITTCFADEAHRAKAKSMQDLMDKLPDCYNRIGLTGTLSGEHVDELVIEGNFGAPYRVITTSQLMEQGMVANLHIKCMVMDYEEELKQTLTMKDGKARKYEYKDEIKWLTECEERSQMLIKLATSLKGTTVLLFNTIEHGKYIRDEIEKITDKPVYYIAGEVSGKKREEIRKKAEMGECILVASTGTTSTGISIKRLDNLILAHPSKSVVLTLQSIGRILRLADDSDNNVKCYDICDDLSTPKRKNFTLRHGEDRLGFYSSENFDFSIQKIKIKKKY